MRGLKFVSVFVLLALLLNVTPGMVLAQGFDSSKEPPKCSGMVDAQIPGTTPGSACWVPVATVGKGPQPLRTIYRSGWIHTHTSEGDSDLVEDSIKVEGFLYWEYQGDDVFEDDCVDPNHRSSHASCRTYGAGGGSGSTMRQDGYHYFHKTGYIDDNFQTQDTWTV